MDLVSPSISYGISGKLGDFSPDIRTGIFHDCIDYAPGDEILAIKSQELKRKHRAHILPYSNILSFKH